MKHINISHDRKKTYSLGENERVTFFLLNRSGDITFRLTAPGAEAHIYALYTGKQDDRHQLTIKQHHLSPQTKSQAIVKSILDERASFLYRGTIRIEKKAAQVVATQENRNLLLASGARVETTPLLEILNADVTCHHAATTSAPKEEQIFALASRGLSREQAIRLIALGFQKDILIHNGQPL